MVYGPSLVVSFHLCICAKRMTTNTGSTQPQTSSNTPANFIQSGSVAHVHPALVPNCSVQYIADLGQFGSQEDIDVLARSVYF